jgi:hypothetical protein
MPAGKSSWLPGWNEPCNALPKILLWPFPPLFAEQVHTYPSSKHYFIQQGVLTINGKGMLQ